MKKGNRKTVITTRAYPGSDDIGDGAEPHANIEDFTRTYHASDKKYDKHANSHTQNNQSQIRFATWNLGTLTGRSQELAKVLQARQINICCLQETRWKGSKSRDMGLGYQLLYHGTTNARNGVAIVLDSNLKQRIIKVDRKSDRIMAIKLAMDNQPPLNVLSAYAPQSGCTDNEKQAFWDDMDEILNKINPNELKYIGGDLNGHVGRCNSAYREIMGNFGYGCINNDGEQILNFCFRHNLALVNTFFNKKTEHLITYKSGNKQSQIDYILTNRSLLKTVRDCKVIPGESLTSQHRILVSSIKLPKPLKCTTNRIPRIKWHLLNTEKGKNLITKLQDRLIEDMENTNVSAEDMWSKLEKFCKKEAEASLGISKGRPGDDKDPTWWNQEVRQFLKNKKECFKQWQSTGKDDDYIRYKIAKKLAKQKVAQTKSDSRSSLYSRLENATNDKEIFKLAKQRQKTSLDIKATKYIKDDKGLLLTENTKINNRWCQYYEQLLNEEFPSVPLNDIPKTIGPLQNISIEEVESALGKMKDHKAVGPDNIPADLWKLLGPIAVEWITKLFNAILTSMKIPESWRYSYLVPFYKNKGDVSDCGNYRGIKLTSHTLKIWERVLYNRLSQLVDISENQFGFMPGKSTTDAIQTVRILMEKHRANKKDLHMVFIDLEKAFDRVPRKLVWQALRSQNVPEQYITLVQDMYAHIRTQVRTPAGYSQPFEVKVGVHQGSALSPFLFNLAMDYLTKDIQPCLPWCLLYADDIVLIDKSADDLQMNLQKWRQALESNGLRISRSKTEYMRCSFADQSTPSTYITLDGQPLPRVDQFKYLGSMLTADVNVDLDVTHRVNAGWLKWRTLSGVLCDPKMPIKLKGKIYKTAVRPAMMYGVECWATKKQHEQKMHTNEMKMLRWAAGVTRLDKIRNEYIRGSFKVAPIAEKMAESRMRWYGHVMRRDEEHVVRKALAIPDKKKGKGRPQATWWTTVTKDMERAQVVEQTTQDRMSWRLKTRRADPK